jgi:hypothetical protein
VLAAGRRALGNKDAHGARLSRANHLERTKRSVASERDGAELVNMLDALSDVGLISRESTFDLARDPGQRRGFGRVLEPLADMVRQLRSAVDVKNQSVVAVAAYRRARRLGDTVEQATEHARDVVRQTQFDATYATSAPALKNKSGRWALQFKRYSVQMMIGMTRMGQALIYSKNMTAAQKSEYRRALLAANLVMLAAAGVSGHPLSMLVGGFMQVMAMLRGEPPDDWEPRWEKWFSRMFHEELGFGDVGAHIAARTIMKGIPSGLGPADISKRLGLGDLIVRGRPSEFSTKGMSEWIGKQLLGAPGETVLGLVDAGKNALKGDWSKAAEAITPKFLANLLRAARSGTTDTRGQPISQPFTLGERVVKGIGFTPTGESDLRDQRAYFLSQSKLRAVRENKLREEFAQADTHGKKHVAWLKIQAYNKRVPEDARIDDESLQRRDKELQKEYDEGLGAGGLKTTKKTADIARASRALNPGAPKVRRKVIQYFD